MLRRIFADNFRALGTFEFRPGRLNLLLGENGSGKIQPWLQTLSDTVDQRGGQALVISHHPEVIDYLGVGDVWWFERSASGPVVVRPADEGAKPGEEGLRLSELVARGL